MVSRQKLAKLIAADFKQNYPDKTGYTERFIQVSNNHKGMVAWHRAIGSSLPDWFDTMEFKLTICGYIIKGE